MSWTPISGTVPQYQQSTGDLASAYYLKAYAAGTSTAINMATDSTGGTTLDKIQINSSGYPVNSSGGVIIPHVSQAYKLVLYKNSTDADNNTTANADWVIDSLSQSAAAVSSQNVEIEYQNGSAATANKFTLARLVYTVGVNNLAIFENGQRLRLGSSYDYTETSSTEVTLTYTPLDNAVYTFVQGETTTSTVSDASAVTYTPSGSGAVATNVQAKLRESVSVKDFGAVGDGVTDDSSAINSALSASKVVRIPQNFSCLISSNIDVPSSGCSIVGEGFTSKIIFSGNNRRINTNYGDFAMMNLEVDGQKPTVGYETTDNTDYGCLVGDSVAGTISGFLFDRVRFKDIGLDGIRLENCSNVTTTETCEFINCRRWGVTIIPDAYAMDNVSIKGYFDSDYGGGPVGKEYPLGAVDTEPNAAHPSLDMTNIRYSDIHSNTGEIAILDKEFDTLDSTMTNVSVTNGVLRVYNNRFNIKGADVSGSSGYFKADITDSIATEINHVDVTFTNTGRSEVRDSTNNRLNLIAADYVDESALGIGVSSSGTGTSSGKVLTDVDGESVYLRQMSLTTGTGTYLFPQTLNATISTNDQVILYLEVERTDSNIVTAPFFFVSIGSAGNIVSTTKLLSTGVNKMCIALQSGATVASCPINFGLSGTVNAQVDCLIRKCFLYVNPDKFNNEMLDVSSVEVTGSYIGTATGISGSPSGSISYTRKGNIVTLTIPSGVFTGTSTSTAFTITGAPIIIRPTASRVGLGRGVDNSAGLTNPISMEMTTAGTLTISSDMAGGTWTASGTKAVSNTTITYNVE